MSILFSYPGQGTQQVGMLHVLPHRGEALLEEASDCLHEDVRLLDSVEALSTTRSVQLCLLIAGVAHALTLQDEGIQPDYVCGLSIGAYPAAVTAGSLSFADAVRLVALRGELMQQAYPCGFGMTALVGLSLGQVENLVARCHRPESPLYIANINAESQIVLSGADAAMQQAADIAVAIGARKAQRLHVSVPSHCELLVKPAEQLAEAFAGMTLQRPRCAYLSGSSARVLWRADLITQDLIWNMARQVRWYEAMSAAAERGVRLAMEMPPGSVLTGLTKPVMLSASERAGEALAVSQQPLETLRVLAGRERDAER